MLGPKNNPLAMGFSMVLTVLVGCQASRGPNCSPPTAMSGAPDPSGQGQNVLGGPEAIAPPIPGGAVGPVLPVRYEDALTGGRVFQMYCGACHNARALGERPFASYQNAATHMRVRANLTGEEYRKLMVYLRYWHDIPPQSPPVEPSPKRLIFSQPLSELRPEGAAGPEAVPPPAPVQGPKSDR
jgi:hypothetical protein